MLLPSFTIVKGNTKERPRSVHKIIETREQHARATASSESELQQICSSVANLMLNYPQPSSMLHRRIVFSVSMSSLTKAGYQ